MRHSFSSEESEESVEEATIKDDLVNVLCGTTISTRYKV